jgi:hypothetical protein
MIGASAMASSGPNQGGVPPGPSADQPAAAGGNSRQSAAGAGWDCEHIGNYTKLLPRGARSASWVDPRPVLQARNDKLARWLGDPTDELRQAWVDGPLAGGKSADFLIADYADRTQISFAVLGDPGEGDGSQFAVVPGLELRAGDTDFAIICSDVIYPAGGVNEYVEKFSVPYKDYPGPIYAVPGNHDWYDGLTGFAFAFCGVPPELPADVRGPGPAWKRRLRKVTWRGPSRPDPRALARIEELRPSPRQRTKQPGPYWAIDAGPLRLIGIDTGITGGLDSEQGDWLRRVSRGSPRPKILVTGKPIYVNGAYDRGLIAGGGTVDEVVQDPSNGYIAAIGGDIHNYQRYPVRLEDGRTLLYLVSGGGGAFMHATHKVPSVDLPGVNEDDFRCYPLRGDSLAMYSAVYDRRFGLRLGLFRIPPDEASALVAERLGMSPTRPNARAVRISRRARFAAKVVFPLPGKASGMLHHYFSEFLDWNRPPMFKSFLRVDADPDAVKITCFAATGCLEHETNPPVEDVVRAARGADGSWRWEVMQN